MIRAVFPGTFDPITLGHLSIIERGAALFAELVVAVADSAAKSPRFTLDERIDFATRATAHLPNVKVTGYTGMTVDFLRETGARVLLRGTRTTVDFEYEMQLTGMYRVILPELEVVILPTHPEHSFITSTLVRDVLRPGGDAGAFVPEPIRALLR